MTSRRAYTLIEILVAMAVLLAVMTTALGILIPSFGRFQTADTAFDAQRQIYLVLSKLAVDAREGGKTYLNVVSAGPNLVTVCIPTARDDAGNYLLDSSLAPEYQAWIIYHSEPDATGKTFNVTRGRLAGTFPPNPLPFAPPASLPPGTLLASGVTSVAASFGATPNGDTVLSMSLSLVRTFQGRDTNYAGDKAIVLPY
jgi:prepilin-type N-terminal cleavage/methylation domain-containing protein